MKKKTTYRLYSGASWTLNDLGLVVGYCSVFVACGWCIGLLTALLV